MEQKTFKVKWNGPQGSLSIKGEAISSNAEGVTIRDADMNVVAFLPHASLAGVWLVNAIEEPDQKAVSR